MSRKVRKGERERGGCSSAKARCSSERRRFTREGKVVAGAKEQLEAGFSVFARMPKKCGSFVRIVVESFSIPNVGAPSSLPKYLLPRPTPCLVRRRTVPPERRERELGEYQVPEERQRAPSCHLPEPDNSRPEIMMLPTRAIMRTPASNEYLHRAENVL